MAEAALPRPGRGGGTYLLVPIILAAVLLSTATIRGPNIVTLSGLGSAIIVAAPLILATYALMALAVAGRGTVDLAIGPLVAFVNVSLVQLNGAGAVTSPLGVFVVGIGIAVLYQFMFALIIIYVRVQPIIVALSGFLALSGLNLVILPRPGGEAPEWMFEWGLGITIFTPILAIVLLATAGWLLFTLTPFYANLRMMGYDERAAFTAGVRINAVRIGAHLIAGVFAGLSAICYTGLIASGDPTQGTTLSLTAITAVVLGGVSLSGGRGGVTGAFLGAVNLFLIGYVLATFSFGAVQAFVTQLFYGLILVLSLLLTLLVPVISRRVSFVSPLAAVLVLGTVVGGIMLHVGTREATEAAVAALPAAPPSAASDDGAARYLLLPPPAAGGTRFVALSQVQATALTGALLLLLLLVVARVATTEAMSLRFGAFMYATVGVLIAVVFVLAGTTGSAAQEGGPEAVAPARDAS